jgi:hypothetical protein
MENKSELAGDENKALSFEIQTKCGLYLKPSIYTKDSRAYRVRGARAT